MNNKMDLKFLDDINRVSKSLSFLKKELRRYYDEEYLNETKDKHPWISVKIGHHPTYLKDFIVNMKDDDLRNIIVATAIQQIKMTIEKLEKELEELLKQKE